MTAYRIVPEGDDYLIWTVRLGVQVNIVARVPYQYNAARTRQVADAIVSALVGQQVKL